MIKLLQTGMIANVIVGGEVSESFSVTNVRLSKIVYWPPRSSPSSYQQCSSRVSETWWLASTYSPDRTLHIQRRTLQTGDQYYSITDERAAIRR